MKLYENKHKDPFDTKQAFNQIWIIDLHRIVLGHNPAPTEIENNYKLVTKI